MLSVMMCESGDMTGQQFFCWRYNGLYSRNKLDNIRNSVVDKRHHKVKRMNDNKHM